MQYYGYAGKILYVDLTSGKSKTEPLDMEMAKKFIGGCGVGERLLYDVLKPGTAPLSPNNPIIISAGPLVGTPAPASAKIQMLTKSTIPANKDQSRYFIPRSCGGSRRFGTMMKRAGYDQIVITGQAKAPVYLKINDDDVEVCNADDLWGKRDIYETSDELTNRHKGSGVIAIGRAGENKVPFSLSWIDKKAHLGRNGGAAVMGSKNLKAIVIHGTKEPKIWDLNKSKTLARDINEEVKRGRLVNMRRERSVQALGTGFSETLTGWTGCSGCALACKSSHEIKDGEFAGSTLESGFGFTLLFMRTLGIKDYRHGMKLLEMCDRLGICCITMARMIRFITRLYERGIITQKDTDGLELKMGDINTCIRLIEKLAGRDGIGDTMARGWFAIGEKVGVDPDTDMDGDQIEKGCSMFFDARFTSLHPGVFEEIVNTKPGAEIHPITFTPNLSIEKIKEWCRGIAMSQQEIDSVFDTDGFNTGRFTKHVEDVEGVHFAMGNCILWVYQEQIYDLRMLAELYAAVTGIETTAEELKRGGERVWNMGKLLNAREGFTRADDVLPGLWAKAIDEPVETSRSEVRLLDYFGKPITHAGFEKMLDDYYDEHGWDINKGVPTKEKLLELGLGEFADSF
jgi:aldehyde:ferredoxin oxidoreductase